MSDSEPITCFIPGECFLMPTNESALLKRRCVTVEHTPIVWLPDTASRLEAVRLADGRMLPLHALFTVSGKHSLVLSPSHSAAPGCKAHRVLTCMQLLLFSTEVDRRQRLDVLYLIKSSTFLDSHDAACDGGQG
ncbi:hypothetical protein HDE76_000808 [Rhodanobacter sp. ANJX3]|uniref:hypothetical protein n=1 Tax=Rhodanobacter sp. ANJX3 TaxID=2723083 RepID=UPI00160B5B31|nr:hypothetical protein [Rhodanobacter sp. ANJX3]MBB5357626.1 hypothetical protein [Rhodanobacter sp. ANJX3]